MSVTIDQFLREKRRYGLTETISLREKKLLASGMPVQKILGFTELAGVKIMLQHKVFIPRYETEEVILTCLQHVKNHGRVLDLCSGSGVIGLALKKARPSLDVTLVDKSASAIKAMRQNAAVNALTVETLQSNLFSNVRGKYDLIVANPPYLPSATPLSNSVLDFEPRAALFGGKDGNKFYRAILKDLGAFLNAGATVVFEIGPDNATYLKAQGFTILNDINGKERIAYRHYSHL